MKGLVLIMMCVWGGEWENDDGSLSKVTLSIGRGKDSDDLPTSVLSSSFHLAG